MGGFKFLVGTEGYIQVLLLDMPHLIPSVSPVRKKLLGVLDLTPFVNTQKWVKEEA